MDTNIALRTITERIKIVIANQLGLAKEEMDDSASLEQLGADSLDQVEIVMGLEDEFEIEIPDEEAENLKTLQQVVDFVTARVPA